MRWLCTALLKASGGEPVDLTDAELREPFELALKTTGDGLRVHVIVGDDNTPNSTTAELEIEVPPGSPMPVTHDDSGDEAGLS